MLSLAEHDALAEAAGRERPGLPGRLPGARLGGARPSCSTRSPAGALGDGRPAIAAVAVVAARRRVLRALAVGRAAHARRPAGARRRAGQPVRPRRDAGLAVAAGGRQPVHAGRGRGGAVPDPADRGGRHRVPAGHVRPAGPPVLVGGDAVRRGVHRRRDHRVRHGRHAPCWSTRPTGCGCPATPTAARCPGGSSLLENLLDAPRRPGASPLIAPLARTAPFTAVLEAIARGAGAGRRRRRPYVTDGRRAAGTGATSSPGSTRSCAPRRSSLALLSELGVPWAMPPVCRPATENALANNGDN